MGWASTLISPPDGDLTAYLASLRRLLDRDDRIFYPGHGAPVQKPHDLMRWLVAHRKEREGQILDVLARQPGTTAAITAEVYADIDQKLHGAARRNVLAHIIDLYQRDLVVPDGVFSADATFRLV